MRGKGLADDPELEAIHQKNLEELARSGGEAGCDLLLPHDKNALLLPQAIPRNAADTAPEHQIDLSRPGLLVISETT